MSRGAVSRGARSRRDPGRGRRGAVRALPAIVAAALLAAAAAAFAADNYAGLRHTMVEEQIRPRGVTSNKVLTAMSQVPRHLFVPRAEADRAYEDVPLSLGKGRSIYQPYIVALMTSLLELDGKKRVLEVGTGSGYHAAVLSKIARQVYSIEIDRLVALQAEKRLRHLGYNNVEIRVGDGYQGWPDEAPFDAILLSAAPTRIPEPLMKQLRVGGKMVVAEGDYFQDLLVITKTRDGVEKRTVLPVRLAPMTGKVRDGQ